ncbi:MAG: hypothetical protein AMXMBFR83_03020 [Phycisphaerae bacterium]
MNNGAAPALICALLLGGLGCTGRGSAPSAESKPSGPAPAETGPAVTSRPMATTAPSPPPATRPQSAPEDALPPSTFDTRPPYTVQLYVRKPEDRQPGWLKVLALSDESATATATGAFPEKNRIEVATANVRRIQVELGYLPLAEGRRVVLRIDNQGIEITQRGRKFITLQRRPTGEWVVERPAANE